MKYLKHYFCYQPEASSLASGRKVWAAPCMRNHSATHSSKLDTSYDEVIDSLP